MRGKKHELGYKHPDALETINGLAVMYRQGDYEKAESLFIQAVEGRRLKLGDTHSHTLDSTKNLIELYETLNKPEKAEEWRAKLPQIEDFEE
jgi:hypothetical protein